MRVSDEDRRRVVEELRRHCAAGRIDVDEFSARIERALSASTFEELDLVRSDLPMLRIAEPSGRGQRPGGAGASRVPAPRTPDRDQKGRSASPSTRLTAAATALITVVVVLTAVIVALVAEWTWALLLLAGWAAGVVQGRLGRRRPD
jgi:DUF1707 SHOCT-like domain